MNWKQYLPWKRLTPLTAQEQERKQVMQEVAEKYRGTHTLVASPNKGRFALDNEYGQDVASGMKLAIELVQLQETTCARRRKDDTMGT